MKAQSKIQWTDFTFNPWRGCTKVSTGCAFCYAETLSKRNPKVLGVWGPGKPRVLASESMWAQPVFWNEAAGRDLFHECSACGHREFRHFQRDEHGCTVLSRCSNPECDEDILSRPVRPRVFCASLADVFDQEVDPKWRERLFELIYATQNLDWLVLTKRAREMNEFLCGTSGMGVYPHDNLWLGVSVENQECANKRIPELLSTDAAVHFLSCEPLLEDVDLSAFLKGDLRGKPSKWVIVGGESGPHARTFRTSWARSIIDQCEVDRSAACFIKQLGSRAFEGLRLPLKDKKGGDWDEIHYPRDLRIREFPQPTLEPIATP